MPGGRIGSSASQASTGSSRPRGVERPDRLVPHRSLGGRVRGRADQHAARRRRHLEPLRDVHRVAEGGVVATRAQRTDEHLAGVDADAHLDVDVEPIGPRADRLLHPQRRPHGPLGVVLVAHRRAEQGDDGVADDLVDAAAERVDVVDEALEAPVDDALHLLGITALGQRGEADEVGEQHRGDAALVRARGVQRHARSSGRTEPLRVRHGRTKDSPRHERTALPHQRLHGSPKERQRRRRSASTLRWTTSSA